MLVFFANGNLVDEDQLIEFKELGQARAPGKAEFGLWRGRIELVNENWVVQNKSNLGSKEDKREMPWKEKLGESAGSAGRKTVRELKFEKSIKQGENWRVERKEEHDQK